MFQAKETWISSGRLGLWLVYVSPTNVIKKLTTNNNNSNSNNNNNNNNNNNSDNNNGSISHKIKDTYPMLQLFMNKTLKKT